MPEPTEYPTREQRIELEKALLAAFRQCGITKVQWALAGPSELFDVADVLLQSDWLASHDAQVKADAWDEGAKYAAEFVSDNAETVADFAAARTNPVKIMGWLLSQFRAPNPYRAELRAVSPTETCEHKNTHMRGWTQVCDDCGQGRRIE